ncbi:MAG: caspase domain-containing protein [Thermosynechococcaceae cyanobacterium]
MALQVEQLVYTSFPETGFKGLAGSQIPTHVQQHFAEIIVNQYWDAYSPPSIGYRAVYLQQVSTQSCLFGWLYNRGSDDLGRDGVPYFLCYYLTHTLDDTDLTLIFDCLERGPLRMPETPNTSSDLDSIIIPDLCHYSPAQPGVIIPSGTQSRCRLLLDQQRLLDFYIQQEPQMEKPLVSKSLVPFSKGARSQPVSLSVPTRRTALLIGVSTYGVDLQPLPSAMGDVEAMREVLEDVGKFDGVQTLLNPDPQAMAEAIETLFLDRNPEDFVLLYFSGYMGVLDGEGKVGLTTSCSRRSTSGYVVRSTVVTAEFINDVMRESSSQHKTLIFDGCFDEAVQPTVCFAPQFRGAQRAVLLSSADLPREPHSTYTFFLVEGLKTGAADLNGDGRITLAEWHRYARWRMQQVSPASDAKMYSLGAVARAEVALAPIKQPGFKYRRQVEVCSHKSQVSVANRVVLDTLYQRLGLKLEEAAIIEAEVFRPHRNHQKKLQDYAIAYTQAIQQGYPLPSYLYQQFKQFQHQLGLTDNNIVPIEAELVHRAKMLQEPSRPLIAYPEVVHKRLRPVLTRGYQWMKPLADRVAMTIGLPLEIATRHTLNRFKQRFLQRIYGLPTELSRLHLSSLIFLCMGMGTALLMTLLAQQQLADRRQERLNPHIPRAERSLSKLDPTQE